MAFGIRTINGVSLGFELYGQEAIQLVIPEAKWGFMVDLLIFHIIIAKM